MLKLSLATVFLAVFVAVAYLYLIRPSRDDVWKWVDDIVAGMVSLLLALAAGFLVYEFQSRMDDEKRRRSGQTAVVRELVRIERLFLQSERLPVSCGHTRAKIMIQYLQPLVLEQSVKNGFLDGQTLNNIAQVAEDIHGYNLDVERFNRIYADGCMATNTSAIEFGIARVRARELVVLRDVKLLAAQLVH